MYFFCWKQFQVCGIIAVLQDLDEHVVCECKSSHFFKVYILKMFFFFSISAKQLVRGEPNVSYICSRYYRAPELIFGATDYTSSIGKCRVWVQGVWLLTAAWFLPVLWLSEGRAAEDTFAEMKRVHFLSYTLELMPFWFYAFLVLELYKYYFVL